MYMKYSWNHPQLRPLEREGGGGGTPHHRSFGTLGLPGPSLGPLDPEGWQPGANPDSGCGNFFNPDQVAEAQ